MKKLARNDNERSSDTISGITELSGEELILVQGGESVVTIGDSLQLSRVSARTKGTGGDSQPEPDGGR